VKYVDEYRNEDDARRFFEAIRRRLSRPHTLMEVCGGQTHTLLQSGIDRLLPDELHIVHGPGCPVCVTPLELIDRAIAIAQRPEVIFTSFGDMLRVPGSSADLLGVKARGGDVRIVYSPLDALQIAASHPDRQVVFFAVGFETTAPPNAMAVWQARQRGLHNFSILCSHVLVPPAMQAILGADDNQVEAFLAAGHVCTVMRSSSPASSPSTCFTASTWPSPRSRRAAGESRTSTPGWCDATATPRPNACSGRCSRSAIGRGAASAASR
jgi:hydrogenase expression/formation protein HypD